MKAQTFGWLSVAVAGSGVVVCILERRWVEALMMAISALEAMKELALMPPASKPAQLPAKEKDETPPKAA